MELFLLYIWLKLESLVVLLAMSAMSALFFAVYHDGVSEYTWKGEDFVANAIKKRNLGAKIFIALIISAIILPSKTDVAILVGANYALKAAETPEAQKVMSILRAKANEILDSELKGEKK